MSIFFARYGQGRTRIVVVVVECFRNAFTVSENSRVSTGVYMSTAAAAAAADHVNVIASVCSVRSLPSEQRESAQRNGGTDQ